MYRFRTRISSILVLVVIAFTVSGCSYSYNLGCTTEDVSEDNSGTLYTTFCTKDGRHYVGLINENFEVVLKGNYTSIDDGLDVIEVYAETLVFSEDVKYFRVHYKDETGSPKIAVIDRDGDEVLSTESYYTVIISEDQTKIYVYDEEQGRIYDIESGTYSDVDYRIRSQRDKYYLTDRGDEWIVLDMSFNIVIDDGYKNVYYVSNEIVLYEKGDFMYSLDRESNIALELFDINVNQDYGFSNNIYDKFDLILLNPNSDVTLISVRTGKKVNPIDCSTILHHTKNHIVMICEGDYKVFDRSTLDYISSIPTENTEIMNGGTLFFHYEDDEHSINNLNKKVVLPHQVKSYEFNYIGVVDVHYDESIDYIDTTTLETLFTTNDSCEVLSNRFSKDTFLTAKNCDVSNVQEGITVLSILNSKINSNSVMVLYYTEEWIYLMEGNETKIVDYDMNILFKY